MDENCMICYEKVFIPVELVCFRCFLPNELSCSSFCRVCRKCAHHYLELDRSVHEREFFKKCLYCPALCDTMRLHRDTAYRKDYTMMQGDGTEHYSCPYCGNHTGTQLKIDQHMDKECPLFVKQCSCGICVPRQDYIAHMPSCAHHELCSDCIEHIETIHLEEHMSSTHNKLKCVLCDAYVLFTELSSHILHSCPERTVTCEYCLHSTKCSKMERHLEIHEQFFQQQFDDLTEKLRNALREYRKFRRLRNGIFIS